MRNPTPGKVYKFNYPTYYVSLPDYSAHMGQPVRVVCRLSRSAYDYQGDLMFLVQANDGWLGHAWASELGSLGHA